MTKRIIILVFGIAIIVSTMIAMFFQMNQRNDIVGQFVKAVEEKDIDKMRQLFQLEKNDLLAEVPLNHFLQYMHQNDRDLQKVVTSLRKQQDDGIEDPSAIVRLIMEEERKYGIFPSSYLNLRKSKLEIEQDFSENLNVKADTTILKKLHKNKFIYGPIYPGEHLIDIQLYHELGEFHIEERVEVWNEALTTIKLDEEDVIAQDASLKSHLYELSALYAKQVGALEIYELNNYLLPSQSERLHGSLQEMSEDLKEHPQLVFKEAIVDDGSYHLMHVQHNWYADVRVIGEYEKEKSGKDELELILFKFEWIFDPVYGEWYIEDIIMSTTENSVLELWNSDIRYGPNDLKLEQEVNGVL